MAMETTMLMLPYKKRLRLAVFFDSSLPTCKVLRISRASEEWPMSANASVAS